MNNVAVVLSGSGVFDGAEINEVVLSLLYLEESGIAYQCFAPDKLQHHVIDHISGDEIEGQNRNILTESARIVRGNVKPLSELKASDYGGLLVPGGFGVAKNLSSFAYEGKDFSLDETFKEVMQAFKNSSKPAGYMCIAPVLLPHIYETVTCTIGNDENIASIIEELGGKHVDCPVEDVIVDERNKVVTTPAYMLASNMKDASRGIKKLIDSLMKL